MVAVAGGIESFSGKGRDAGGGDCRSRVLEDRRGIEILAFPAELGAWVSESGELPAYGPSSSRLEAKSRPGVGEGVWVRRMSGLLILGGGMEGEYPREV